MSRLEHEALAWMRARHQAIATSDLRDLGVSPDQQDRMVANGQLRPVLKGAYVAGSADPDEVGLQTALCLARPDLVIAALSAGRHWGLRFMGDDRLVHAIAPPASHPCNEPWVKVYRTALLDPDDIITLSDGRRVTSPPRTVVDVTRYVSASTLTSVIEHVISLGYCSQERLGACAEQLNTPGRRRIASGCRPVAGRSTRGRRRGMFEGGFPLRCGDQPSLLGRRFFQFFSASEASSSQLAAGERGAKRRRSPRTKPTSHWTPEGIARDQARDAAAAKLHWVTRRGGPVRLSKQNRAATIADAIDDIARRRDEIARLTAVGLWPPPR